MKKILTSIILTIIFLQGFSQSINYGIGTGLNFSSLTVANYEDEGFKYKPGFQLNAVFGYSINDKVGLRIEPGYANKGTILDIADSKLNINYFTIPLLAKFSPLENFSILFGPEFSFLLTAKSTIDHKKINISSTFDNKIDFGINTGLSYRLINKLEIGLRYNRGFIPPTKNIQVIVNGEHKKITNQSFAFLITYMIK